MTAASLETATKQQMNIDDCRLFLGFILEVNNSTAFRIQHRPVETKTSPLELHFNMNLSNSQVVINEAILTLHFIHLWILPFFSYIQVQTVSDIPDAEADP